MKLPSSMDDNKLSCSERSSCCMPASQRRFSCPLTKCIMEDPVSVPCCGTNFERKAILKWMRKNGNRCPESGERLSPSDLTPNAMLQWEILYLERKEEQKGTSSRTVASGTPPAPHADTPPSMPRPHSTSDVRRESLSPKKTSRSRSTTPNVQQNKKLCKNKAPSSRRSSSSLNESCHSRGDLPPTKPRSQIAAQSTPSIKRTDSAPSLPQRKNADGYHMQSQELGSLRNDEAFPSTFSENDTKQNVIISLIDDVLAILEEGSEQTHGTKRNMHMYMQ
jgi:hypothetical protein